jgi:hypothetical protein
VEFRAPSSHHATLVTLHHAAQPLARCVMSFPLMLGHDVRNQTADTLRILTNEELLNVSADALGRPARLVAGDLTSQTQVYLRQLHTGRCSWYTCVSLLLYYYFIIVLLFLLLYYSSTLIFIHFCPLFFSYYAKSKHSGCLRLCRGVCMCVMMVCRESLRGCCKPARWQRRIFPLLPTHSPPKHTLSLSLSLLCCVTNYNLLAW